MLLAIWRASKRNIAYICSAFCNSGHLRPPGLPAWTPNLASTARSQPWKKWVPGDALSIDLDLAKGTPFAGVQQQLIKSK